MTTLIKLVIASVLALLIPSGNTNLEPKGTAKVKTDTKTFNGSCTHIEFSKALEVTMAQESTKGIYFLSSVTSSISVNFDNHL